MVRAQTLAPDSPERCLTLADTRDPIAPWVLRHCGVNAVLPRGAAVSGCWDTRALFERCL